MKRFLSILVVDPTTGNQSSKSEVGAYTYSPTKPHDVTQAGSTTYSYDQNGNMTSRTVGGVVWTYTYNAEGQLTAIRKNNQLVSEYVYDGDGKRVWGKDYEGHLPENPKLTLYVGDYYEVQVEGYKPGSGGAPTQPCSLPSYCAYFPFVARTLVENVSYYYADGQRIAMKNNGVVTYLYGDQLGSTTATADVNGNLVSQTLYQPWGAKRYTQGTSPTEYGFTGQKQEEDIYFYNTRWYDSQLGRFMQADTIVPIAQGTQGLDRYAYINNNPVNGTDPTGHEANWFGELLQGFSLEIIRTNNWLGAILSPNTARQLDPSPSESEAMLIGGIAADLTTTVLGILEINAGIGIAGGGAVVGCGTTLCLASAPAVAAGSAAVTLGALTSLSGAVALGENLAYFSNRHKNDLGPDPNATGPHSTFKIDPITGKVTNYETYEPQTNPQNPNPWSKILRFDGSGRPHPETGTGIDLLPHLHDFINNLIRRPFWFEIPE